jgi:hypothetical protein
VSGRTITRYVLACDGCGAELPEAQSSVEARGAAYAAGWRFPAQTKADGSTSSNANDVCPKCLPGWRAQPSRRRGPGQPSERRRP